MYDCNYPEALTQERLTLILLSIVIPTDRVVLKNIYNKKKELEIIKAEFTTDPDKRDYTVSSQKLYNTGFACKYNLDDGIKQMIKEVSWSSMWPTGTTSIWLS